MGKEFKQEFSIKSIPTDDTLLLENTLNAMSSSGWELYSIYEAEQNSKIVYNCIFVKETQVTDDEITDASRIIIIKLEEKGSIGIIVDEVREVITLNMAEVEKTTGKDSFINGIGKNGDELISLFEINAIVEEKEMN